ncbi:MAG: GAF domain-containing protein [Chloroflexota bacterium]
MSDVKTFEAASTSTWGTWTRLAPLVAFGYQIIAGIIILAMAFLVIFPWFNLPFLGVFLDSNQVVVEMLPLSSGETASVLRPGDHLSHVDGKDVRSAAGLSTILSSLEVGDVVEVNLQARSGHITKHEITLSKFSVYDQLNIYFVTWVVGIAFLGTGLWTLRLRPDDKAALAYGVFSASFAIALGVWIDVWTAQRVVQIWLIAMGFSAAGLLHLTLVFPREQRFVARFPILLWIPYLIGLGLAGMGMMNLAGSGNPEGFTTARQYLVWYLILSWVIFLVTLVVRRFSSKSPVEREQARILIWGNLLSLLPGIFYYLAETQAFLPIKLPFLVAVLPLSVLAFTTLYTILRYRTVNTSALIGQALVYSLLTVITGGGYALLISGASLVTNQVVSASDPFIIGIFAFIFALLLNPLRTRVQQVVDLLFFRGGTSFNQQVDLFAESLAQVVNLDEIVAVLRENIFQRLQPVRLHVYVYDNLVDRYVATQGEDGRNTTDIRFPRTSALVHTLFDKRAALFLESAEDIPSDLKLERSRLALLGSQLFLALPGQERLSGWLALGPRASGASYQSEDLEFLTALAELAATAIDRAQVMADKDRRVHEMNVLTRVAQGVNVTLNFDDILELLFAQTRQVIPADDFNITLYEQSTNILRNAFIVQQDERLEAKENQIVPLGYGLEREVLQARRPIITDDFDQESRNRRTIPNREGVFAWIGVPLNAGAEIIGVISVGSRNPAVIYTEDQYNILQAIADQAAGAIVKARLLEESETRARQLAGLNEVTRGLTSTLELDPLLQNILNSAVEILNCEAGSLLLVDMETDELVFEVVVGPVAEQFLGDRLEPGVGIAGKAAEEMRPMIVNNVEQSSDWFSEPDQETGFKTKGMLVVPMHYKGTVIGVLQVLNKLNGMPFTIDDQELLTAFAGQAAVAVENVRLYTQTDQELSSRVEELSVMQRIDRELNTSLDVSRAMEITLDWSMRQSKSLGGLIGILETDGLRVVASEGDIRILEEFEDMVLPLTLHGFSEVIEEGAARRVDAVALMSGGALMAAAQGQVIVPIRREEEVIGMLVLESESSDRYDDATMDFLTRLSDHASIAISNAQLYAEVQRANVAKSDFVSFVSHELKTPMTSIRGYADLLAAGSVGEVSEAQMDFLNTIRTNIQRMATLVSDLADVSRIEAGRLSLEFASVSLGEIVDEVMRSTKAMLDEKQLVMELDIPEDLPLVWGDRNRLAQIITNLASNAVKYTPEQGTVWIKCQASENVWDEEGAPQVVHLSVKDSGIGIKEEDQQKIFQQYFRTAEGKETAAGTGLGLNITRNLVEMQGGKIWFDTSFGEGSNFQFTIPISEEG